MKAKERKSETITIRCTPEEKNKMERKAMSQNKTLREYICDSAIAGTERRMKKDKNRIASLVMIQQQLNTLNQSMRDNYSMQENTEEFEKLLEEENKLWV